ncbi:MAG: prepilin-type N-terminal cleavage/methylation domain-containing protein [Deltaproteobacteria bacterium]|nr:prepilin-type N-terminal cleavage/methylation domain-containing protein [Deltaproteobacteria bacterium]
MKGRKGTSGSQGKGKNGFTLIELMVVIALVGILALTAVPLYRTWLQRAYGSEASLMMKKLMDGQILYYLENNDEFFPKVGQSLLIPAEGTPTPPTAIQDVKKALKIEIPQGHRLDYNIYTYVDQQDDPVCMIIISASFPLFKDGHKQLIGMLNKEGKTYIFTGG